VTTRNQTKKRSSNLLLLATEEWLIVLIAILILLAIAIGAASAKTSITTIQRSATIDDNQTFGATLSGEEDKE